MIASLFKVFAGRHHKRFVKKCQPTVARINALEQEYQSLTEEQLRDKTNEFRDRFKNGETLDDLLPEAFAAVKNAARRLCGRTISFTGMESTWEMVHYDVQLIGGMALHNGRVAEMATGEGKTLVATLPLYLNALAGRGSQLVTVNDYLARRDSEWMGHLYTLLGLTVGCIQSGMDPTNRKEMYRRDITYGTASEFGFDYLRDNGIATRAEDQVQHDHFFCIIDEADSILIDEARTPLIISGPAQDITPLPFHDYKPGVQELFRKQNDYLNRLAKEAKDLIDSAGDGEIPEQAIVNLYQVRQGMPKNKFLMRLQESSQVRRQLEKFDLEMNGDYNKKRRFQLKEELYFAIDEKQHNADLTEKGRELLKPNEPEAFVLPDLPTIYIEIDKDQSLDAKAKEAKKVEWQDRFAKISEGIHCISKLLQAYSLYERDVEYVVQDGKVMIVDENTGRLMPGRRWSDGLHQAVESKENVTIEKETRTYASITIQNYFRMYEKLAGMTGTAETEASEFHDIYRLGVTAIPTHQPCLRIDDNDVVYKSRRIKYNAVLKEIQEAHGRGQPVLVGTASVESSEVLSRMLKGVKIPHAVLNAKFHQQEAEIVSRAGQLRAVTIATNMAGRGTDIKLGQGVSDLGGLFVIGTERHESRRIDRQLRGRCARQGDPGRSKFFVALEDDLMRLFANAGPIARMLEKTMSDEEELTHPSLNWSIENAQKKVEQQNYSIRKRLLQYDDVLNRQRSIIYDIRNQALHVDEPREVIFDLIAEELQDRIALFSPTKDPEIQRSEREGLLGYVNAHFPLSLKVEDLESTATEALGDALMAKIRVAYEAREGIEEKEALHRLERFVLVRSVDRHWQGHLTEMEDLRRSVGLRSYGQKDPLSEYKSEAYKYFEQLMQTVRQEVVSSLFRTATNAQAFQNLFNRLSQKVTEQGPAGQPAGFGGQAAASGRAASAFEAARQRISASGQPSEAPRAPAPKIEPVQREEPKVGRNDPCPCGSGKKYKKCCGAGS
jgi:preprotein translocase subunit SecA